MLHNPDLINVGEIAGLKISDISPVAGGRNNRCFRAKSSEGDVFIKSYFFDPGDNRDRLKTEFTVLSFLWENGVRCIPEPLACDCQSHIGLYRFLNGEPVLSEITNNDVSAFSELLLQMWEMRTHAGFTELPDASEACFKPADSFFLIRKRIGFLQQIDKSCDEKMWVHKFINGKFTSFLEKLAQLSYSELQIDIEKKERTLSPSDLGFHNALRKGNGDLVFFDFEYAGWDDPAKMLSDAILQPDKPVPGSLLTAFFKRMKPVMGDLQRFQRRMELAYFLTGLKWCLILLNEFLPVAEARRKFSDNDISIELKRKRIDQVKKMFHRVEKEFDDQFICSLFREMLR